MTYKTFAAINVGSGEVSMKIYEISPKTGIREIDYVRYYIELGSDTYTKGYIEYDLVRELCDVLEGFSTKMEEYRVDSYLALGSSALIEASNCELIVDQIRVRTGLKVETIDNAQQRFLLLKSVARGMRNFEQLIDDGAAIVDMGSGSLQITIYDEGRLIYTQNLKLGSLRIREILADLEGQTDNFVNVMEDYIGNYIDTFSRLFMHERKVRHIIAVGEEMESIVKIIGSDGRKNHMERHAFDAVCGSVLAAGEEELSAKYSIPYELATVLKPAIIVYKKIIEISGAEKIWAAGCDLCDGMIVDYAERQEQIEPAHFLLKILFLMQGQWQPDMRATKSIRRMSKKQPWQYLTASKREQDWISATAFFCRWPVFFMTAASMSICLVVQITAALLFVRQNLSDCRNRRRVLLLIRSNTMHGIMCRSCLN